MSDVLDLAMEVESESTKGSAPATKNDPREQAIRDRYKISQGSDTLKLAAEVEADMEIDARRQQRAYAEKASLSDPDTYIATTKMLLSTGNRSEQLAALRKLTPKQREEALRLAPGVAQQLGDDRGGAVMRTIDAVSKGAAGVAQPVMELTGLGGTREEIDYLHKLNSASQEFAPARPDDPWYSRGALQAAEMAPGMVMAAGGGGAGSALGKISGQLIARGAAAGVPGAKAAFKAAGAIGKVPAAVGLKAATTKGVFEGVGSAAGVTASMWAPQYAQEVDSLKELGMKDGFALRALAGATAAAVGLLESIVPNPWKGGDVSFKQGVIKAVRQHLWNTAKNLPGEVTEEGAQGIASGVGEHVAQYLDKDAKKKSIGEAFSKGWQQASDSVLPLVFMLGAPGVAGATGAAIRARRAQLEQLRSKGFVSKGDAKEVGIEGGTRKEIAAKVDAEIEDLKSRELIASVNESGTAAESANAIPEQAGVPSGSQQGDISAPTIPGAAEAVTPESANAIPEQAGVPPSSQQGNIPAPAIPGAAEAVTPEEASPVASVAEDKPADAIGERTKVMDTSVIRAKSVTDENNIRYELFESEDGKSGIIRQMDMDAGQVVSMTRYPSIDKAQEEFGRYEKIASPLPVSQEQAAAKPSVSPETPSPGMVSEPSSPVAEKAAPDQQAPVSPPSKFASWTVQQGSDGKLYRVDPKAKTKYEKVKTRQPVDPTEVVVATQDQFGNPINKELVAVRQDFANNAKPGAEFTWAPYAPAKFKVTKNGDILDVTTNRPMGTVQSTANSPALKKGSIKWTSLPSPAAQEAAQPKPDITQMPPSQPVQVSKPSPETQKSQPEPQESAVPVPAVKPISQEASMPPRVAEPSKSQALPPSPQPQKAEALPATTGVAAVSEEPVSRKKVVDHFTKIQQDQGAGEYVKSSVDKTYGRIWEKVRKSPWKTVNDLSVKGRDGKPRSRMVRDSVTKMKEAGFLTVAWDKDGNPHYAVPGAELPAWLTQSRNDSDLAKLPPKTAQTPPSAVAERVAEKAEPEPSQAESSKVISEKPKSSAEQMTPRSYLESKSDRELKTLAKDLGVKADSREGVIESLLQNPDVVDSLTIALQKAKPSKPRKKKPAPVKDAAKRKESIPVKMRSSDGKTRELLPSELTSSEKKQKSILEKMGVTLRVVEGGNFNTPGMFNPNSMTVWLDRSYMEYMDSLWEEQNRPPESMTWGLFSHEMFHAIKKVDPESWNELRDWINANPNEKALLDEATGDYVRDSLDAVKQRLLNDAKRSGKKARIEGRFSTVDHVRKAIKAAKDAGVKISDGTNFAADYAINVLTDEDLRNEEGLSRYLEDKAGDFSFWNDLGNEKPGLLAKIGRWLLRALRLADSNTLAGQTRAAIEKAMRRNNLATGEDSGIRAAAGKDRKVESDRKARTLDEVRSRVAKDYSLTVSDEPMQTVDGKSFSSFDPDAVGDGLLIKNADAAMQRMMNESLQEAGVPEEIASTVKVPSSQEVDYAFRLTNGSRYWYELSAVGFVKDFFGLSRKLTEHLIDIVAGTSGGQKPTDNLKIAVAAMSQDMQGKPVSVGTRDESSLTAALSPAMLETHKFGNFSDTMQVLGGLRPGVKPLPTIDLQMAAVFGVPHAAIASDPRMYEAMSRFLIKLRDAQNASLKKGEQPYESWQIQALLWVAQRDTVDPDSYNIGMPKIVAQLKQAGIPTPGGKITTETLMDPRTAEVLAPTSKIIPEAYTATVETRTKLTKVGKESAEVYEKLKAIDAPWARKLVDEFEKIQRRTMRSIGNRLPPKPGNKTRQKSVASQLLSVIMNKSPNSHELSRVDTDAWGTFEGDASPNIRFPLNLGAVGGTEEGGGTKRYVPTSDHRKQFLSVLGKYLKQAGQAASQFVPATYGSHDTFTILVRRYDKVGIAEGELAKISDALGRPISYKQVPNGWQLDINIGGFDETAEQKAENRDLDRLKSVMRELEQSTGKNYDWYDLPRSYASDYIDPSAYNKHIRNLENAISRNTDTGGSGKGVGYTPERRASDYAAVVEQIKDIAAKQESAFRKWTKDARELAAKRGVQLGEQEVQDSGQRYSPGRRGDAGYDSRSRAPLADAPKKQGATGPDPEIVQAAEGYARSVGIDLKRQAEYVEVDEDRARRIAQAFESMSHSPNDPAVKEAYDDLIRQTKAQYDALVKAGYTFTFYDGETDPYSGNPYSAVRDLRQNKTMAVYGTYDGYGTEGITDAALEGNPMLADTGLRWKDQNGVFHPVVANDLFRAVHDAFGHSMEGAGFRARGEENAWQAHVRLYYGPAIGAMTSETRGQNSWLNFGPYAEKNKTAGVLDTVFAENKIGLMPEWTWTEGRAADMEDVGDADMNGPDLESGLQYAVARPQLAKKLNSGKKVKLYRAMLLIDGKLYPPMSSRSKSDEGRLAMRPGEPIGQWMQSEERPELVPKTGKNAGKFPLQKPKGVTWAAYAPYFHASPMPLNDQFTASWLNDGIRRPRMVIVEVEVPASEMTSGYQAEGSSKKVGSNKWRAGVVASKLPGGREVVLSRYLRIKRIVPDAEVAKKIADIVNPARLSIPENVITPQLRAELEKNGVRISPKGTKGEAIRYSAGRQTETPAFKKWFGDSKVVDEDGNPLVVYHGTVGDFSVFKATRTGEFGPAIYTTADPKEAAQYAVGSGSKYLSEPPVSVMPLYVSLQNPFTDGVEAFWKKFYREGDTDAQAVQKAIDSGFDGVIATREEWNGKILTHYIAFRPEQVKSAIGNRGTFDQNNPDIRYSPGRRVDEKYLAAVKDGDKKLAQRMVNKAAQKAGEFAGGVSPVVYHGSPHAAFYKFQIPSKGFNSTVFGSYEVSRNAAFFTPDKTAASNYQTQGGRTSGSTRKFRIFGEMLDWRNGISDAQFNTLVDNGVNSRWLGQKGASWELFDKEQDPDGTLVKAIKKMGYDGVIIRDTDGENDFDAYVAFSPSQIKSSDPVTYDDAGNVIPLSKRFDDLQSDVRYSPGRKKDAILAALYKQLEEKGAIKPKAAGDRTTSIKNRKTDELRAESGFPPRVRPSSESFEEWEERARQQYPTAKDRLKLIAEAERYPERMGKIESAAIGQHITYLDNQRIAGKDVADELRRTIKVANIVGTEAGRALVSRRAERYGDFSLAGLISEHMRVAGTDPTDSQIQDYAELADRIKQLETDKIELAEKLAKETIARIKAEEKAKPTTEPQKPKQGTKRAALLKKVADSFAAFQNAWGQERSSVGRTPALETIADFGFGTETLPDPATVSRSEWLRAYMPLVMQGVPDADISEKDMNVLASAFGDDNPFAPNSKLMKMLGKWAIQSDLHEANWGDGVRVLFEDKSPATRMMLEQISKESGVSANRDDFYDPADYKSLAKAFVKYLPKHLAKKPEGYSYGYSDTKRLLETSKALLDPLEYAINVWESSQRAEVADADIRYSPGRQGDATQAAAANLVKLLREMGVSSTLEFELQIKANLKNASPEQMQALMDAWNASSEKTDVISPLGDDPDNADIGARAKELMRLAIEAGYGATPETWMEVVDVVHEQLSLDVPGIDKYDTMQAMSDYGVWRKLSGEEVAVKTRAIRGKARQSLKIEDTLKAIAQSEAWLKDGVSPEEVARRLREKNLLPKATGREQATPDSIERELIAEFNKLKKTLPVPAESREGQLKSALSTAKTSAKNRLEMLDNDISALEDAVKNRKELVKPVAEKTRLEPDAELEDLRSQLDAKRRQRDELKAEYNKIFPSAKAKQGRKPLTDEQRLEASMKLLARQIDAVKADIQALSSGSWAPAAKNAELTSARKEQLKSDLASLRETQKRARKASPLYQALQETKYWERYRKTQEKRLAFWENRRDEAKAGRLPVPLQKRTIVEKDILDKNLEIEEAKYEAMIAIEKATRANWNAGQWIGQGLLEATSLIPKTLMLGLEMSFVLRQGFFYTYSQPMKAFRALTEAMPAVFSQRLALASMESIENRPNADEYLDAKVDFTKATGPQAKLEELYQSAVIQWLERTETKLLLPLRAWAKVYQMFERGNRTFSNIMKADMYDIQKRDTLAAREFFGLSTEWTKNDIKETGRITNIFSGRGTGIKGGSPWLDWLFLARRWTWSRIQADFIVPFQLVTPEWIGQWNADRGMRVALAKLYIQALVGHAAKMAAAYFAYSVLAGDDEEKKPTMEFDLRSSDALALKVGETRFKDEGGMMPAIVLAARIATGTIKTGKGEIKSIYGEDVQHGGKTAADFLINYGRYKLGTAPSAILEWISGRDAVGTVIEDKDDPTAIYRNIAASRLTPLTYREIYAAENELGLKRGTLAALEAFFGVSVSTHGDRTKYKKGSEADRKKQFDNDLKAMQWNSPDPAYSDLLSNEQMEEVSKRREAKRQGLIFAAGANPQRKDYKNAENYDKAVAERDKARQEMAESGITLPEARSLLIEYYKDNYGSAYELKGGSYVMKGSAVARLREIKRQFSGK